MKIIAIGEKESQEYIGHCDNCKAYWLADLSELKPVETSWAGLVLMAFCFHDKCTGRERVQFYPVLDEGRGRDLWNRANKILEKSEGKS